jgi:RND family efflux transporter MFP subunit
MRLQGLFAFEGNTLMAVHVVMNSSRKNGLGRWAGFGVAILVALISSGLAGCGRATGAPPGPPPAAVTVARPVQKEVVEWDTYTGHLEAPESVNVAARVSGQIVDEPFKEGSIVKKGDLLFVIDDRPFKADLDAKQADVEKAQAQLLVAKVTYDRQLGLQKDKAVSQQDVDNAKAAFDQASAEVAGAQAAVETSKLNLEWCRVLSPIDGRVSNKLVTVGNLVNGGAGQATLLTTVQSVTPMYCYVDVDEHSVLKYQQLAVEKKRISARDGWVPCYVQLANQTGFPYEGYIDFVDNHVDPATGTLRARGVLDNSSGFLVPGFFARMVVPGSGKYQTLLVPDTAIGSDQNQRNVLVVDDQNTVQARVVEPGALFGTLRSIVSGLKPDDRVIINGQMHARPGAKVSAMETTIQVDPAAFSDPATAGPTTIPTTGPASTDASVNPAAAPQASFGEPSKLDNPAGSNTPSTQPTPGTLP